MRTSTTPTNLSLLIFLSLLPFSCFTQSNPIKFQQYKNIISVEAFGHGFAYSLNYERVLFGDPDFKATAQIGVAYYGKKSGLIPLWVPISINVMTKTFEGQYLELGFGKMLNDDGFTDAEGVHHSKYKFDDSVFRLGYRFQSPKRRWLVKLAYTPIFQDKSSFIHWGAIGFGFKI